MTGRSLSLLERWDQYMADGGVGPKNDEIRRAIAIAQAVEEMPPSETWQIMRRADELLERK